MVNIKEFLCFFERKILRERGNDLFKYLAAKHFGLHRTYGFFHSVDALGHVININIPTGSDGNLGMFGFGGKLAQGVLNAQALGNQRGKVFDKGVIAVQELVNRVIPRLGCQPCGAHTLVNRPYFCGVGVKILLCNVLAELGKLAP